MRKGTIRFVIASSMLSLVGCSSYQVPDYYLEPNIVHRVGVEYKVKDLRCSQRGDKCHSVAVNNGDKNVVTGKQAKKSAAWISHRTYPKKYYFE